MQIFKMTLLSSTEWLTYAVSCSTYSRYSEAQITRYWIKRNDNDRKWVKRPIPKTTHDDSSSFDWRAMVCCMGIFSRAFAWDKEHSVNSIILGSWQGIIIIGSVLPGYHSPSKNAHQCQLTESIHTPIVAIRSEKRVASPICDLWLWYHWHNIG